MQKTSPESVTVALLAVTVLAGLFLGVQIGLVKLIVVFFTIAVFYLSVTSFDILKSEFVVLILAFSVWFLSSLMSGFLIYNLGAWLNR